MTARALCAGALALAMSFEAGVAQQARAQAVQQQPVMTPAEVERLERHRRDVQEGERQSRAMRVPAARSTARSAGLQGGVVQIPMSPKAKGLPLVKDAGTVFPHPPPCPYRAGMRTASLIKVFAEVAWHICVTDMGLKGLWIGPVQLGEAPGTRWRTLIHQAGLAEIFVPYHGNNGRWYDMQFTSALDQLTAADAGSNGSLITLTNEAIPTVIAEVRGRGIGWLCKQTTAAARRAEQLVLWGVSDAGNYDNIIEYTFGDDGSIGFRTGNTGYNSPSAPLQPHSHNSLWRIDIDVNGAAHDRVYRKQHLEPQSAALPLNAVDTDVGLPTEMAGRWLDTLDTLLVTDNATNGFGKLRGYQFIPTESGVARHLGWGELWTQNDFFLTRYHANEFAWSVNHMVPDLYLLAYLDNESIVDTDVVVWAHTTVHHEPSSEDKSKADSHGGGGTTGITLAHWSGLQMRPYNYFSANPLGGPSRCGS